MAESRLSLLYQNKSSLYIKVERVDCMNNGTIRGVYILWCRIDYTYYCRMKLVYRLRCRDSIVHIKVQWRVLNDNDLDYILPIIVEWVEWINYVRGHRFHILW